MVGFVNYFVIVCNMFQTVLATVWIKKIIIGIVGAVWTVLKQP